MSILNQHASELPLCTSNENTCGKTHTGVNHSNRLTRASGRLYSWCPDCIELQNTKMLRSKKKPFLEILELIPRAPTPPIRRDGEVTQRKMVKQHRRINESSRLRLAFAPQRLLINTSMVCMQELRMKCLQPKKSKSM